MKHEHVHALEEIGCGCGHECGRGRSDDHGGHSHDHDGGGKRQLILMIIGTIVFAAALAIEHIFDVHKYVELGAYIVAYAILGGDIVISAAKNIMRGQVFDENFLMTVASLGAFAIGEYPEAVAVMLFYKTGEYFQDMAVGKSRRSIAELMDIRPDFANVRRGDSIVKLSPEEVRVGDIIVVKPGEKIPLDGVVRSGISALDTSALTGESLPRDAVEGDSVLSGCINQTGLLEIEVTKDFGESTVSKIMQMVESASKNKAPMENFITKFSRYYTPAVVAIAALLAVVPPIFASDWAGWLGRGLIFLVVSCPCALVISIPLSFFGGIGAASRRGILVKGGNYFDALAKLDIAVFDKTGTLTKGVFEVTKIAPASGYSERQLLETAAYAESFSPHPIALSIQKAYGADLDSNQVSKHVEIPGKGISAEVGGVNVLAGSYALMRESGVVCDEIYGIGTKVYIAADGVYMGGLIVSDEVKADSAEAVAALKSMGVRTVMLTGDNAETAEVVAGEMGIDEVYSGLLPNDKVAKVEAIERGMSGKGKMAFVGDGINDAPVLARADVGIAMGALGSDAAIEAADIVLMTDEPNKIIEAVCIAKATNRTVWQNIVFALGVKGVILALGAMGLANMWAAVFADVGVALLATLNAGRVVRKKG